MANEFSIQRTAHGSFTLPNSSATSSIGSGDFIPAGAIITGIRIAAPEAVTLTGASGTVVPRVGTVNLAATVNVSGLPAVSVGGVTALATTSGIYVTNTGELNLLCGASSNSAATATYDYYVDYIYAG
jgi:hypothetical protein